MEVVALADYNSYELGSEVEAGCKISNLIYLTICI